MGSLWKYQVVPLGARNSRRIFVGCLQKWAVEVSDMLALIEHGINARNSENLVPGE